MHLSKEKTRNCLGNALKNNILNYHQKNAHGDIPCRNKLKTKKLEFIIHETSLETFLSEINLSETERIEEKNIKIIGWNRRKNNILSKDEEKELLETHQKLKSDLIIPRRPYWDSETTVEDLERNEKEAFLNWRRKLAFLEEKYNLQLTPFERNLEVWRQLWRVIEKCDLIVQIVDARNPLLYKSRDLELYVEEMNKKNFLLINKADFLTEKQRKCWADYFKMKGISYTFFSAIAKKDNKDEYIDKKHKNLLKKVMNEIEEIFDEKNLESEEDSLDNKLKIEENNHLEDERIRIVSVDELKDIFFKELQVLNDNNNNTEHFGKFYVGLVGYPNVGKSSTINSMISEKKVSVSSTPGKTKHFQTIHITDKIVLCDCPGLVFPNFTTTKAELVCNGVLSIDQLKDYISPIALIISRISKEVLEMIYGISLQIRTVDEDGIGILSAEEFIEKYASSRGIDKCIASRHIIKDYINGKLLFCTPPPEIDPYMFNLEHYDTFKLSGDKCLQTKDSTKNRVINRPLQNNKKQTYSEDKQSLSARLSKFDQDFFSQNTLSLNSNQKIAKGFYYKKHMGPFTTHSFENHQNNILNKSKKHFNVYKRKKFRIQGID
ncbi:hypothetical protein T552_00240 [Pneumocystis carinii B80]|uniref:CP-type G domain-containing protein n=1 Tax=Pneumocystis carinii (strain B80) TaxID=1408658 RepID=A0A0W4ZT99_PNEC8|nr:hypothetical protein T552_00240 [Pneumocystis carinii B80]KTW31602.1 hypothetical protein T552_00240 [Pneumocystis carinii B80]